MSTLRLLAIIQQLEEQRVADIRKLEAFVKELRIGDPNACDPYCEAYHYAAKDLEKIIDDMKADGHAKAEGGDDET